MNRCQILTRHAIINEKAATERVHQHVSRVLQPRERQRALGPCLTLHPGAGCSMQSLRSSDEAILGQQDLMITMSVLLPRRGRARES